MIAGSNDYDCRLLHLAHDTVGGIVERAGELAALQMPVHAHMLRHSTGYYLANRGIDTRTIQSYLGHNNIQHTVRYRGTTTSRAKLYHDRLKTSVQQCFGRSISLMGMNHFTALIDGLIERFISKYCGWSI